MKSVLLVYEIEIHTDRKNLVYETMLISYNRLMCWQLIIGEYGPETKYIPGPENLVVDALSRLPIVDKEINTKEFFACHIVSTHQFFARRQNIPDKCPLNIEIVTHM